MNKVGICIINYNCAKLTDVTLHSLLDAKNETAFVVGLIDNGSSKDEKKQCEIISNHYFGGDNNLTGFYISSDKNLGFSGGNNVIIRRFLQDEEITHICLLNSDVIVTDGWLDKLIEIDADAIGPVTNATGNEQTIAINYEIEKGDYSFETVNNYAKERSKAFGNHCEKTDLLHFFATLFKRELIEKVGLLDERFYPGSYEDNDYCMRIINEGYTMLVHRGCYIHHFGSGSFSTLDMGNRVKISNVNRKRFEEKWNVHYSSNEAEKLILSCIQDLNQLKTDSDTDVVKQSLESSFMQIGKLINENGKTIEYYRSIIDGNNENAAVDRTAITPQTLYAGLGFTQINGTSLFKAALYKLKNKLFGRAERDRSFNLDSENDALIHNVMLYVNGSTLLRMSILKMALKASKALKMQRLYNYFNGKHLARMSREICSKHGYYSNDEKGFLNSLNIDNIGYQVTDELLDIVRTKNCICLFAVMFNKQNERDGYIQRVKAIDRTVLNDENLLKIYFQGNNNKLKEPVITHIDDEHVYVEYNSYDKRQLNKILDVISTCGKLYVHSAIRFVDGNTFDILENMKHRNIQIYWDVHGSLPEEYELINDEKNCQKATLVQLFLYKHAYTIICVNEAMKEYLVSQYGDTNAKIVILPIFHGADVNTEVYNKKNDKPIIIYSGGTQKWQNVDLMKDIIQKTSHLYTYNVFVPNPNELKRSWGSPIIDKINIGSRKPDDMPEEYIPADYGFVLRDDIVVNNVACPTKIIEYLQYGIIPILLSDKIGDFSRLGMKYVSYKQVLDNDLPNLEERQEMIKCNLRVLDKLVDYTNKGTNELKTLINNLPEPVVGLVVTTFDKGGLEQVVLNLYKGYTCKGIKTYVMCQEDVLGPFAEMIDQDNLYVFKNNAELFYDFLEKKKINTLHYHYNVFEIEASRKKGFRVIYTMHNVYAWMNDEEITKRASQLRYANYVVPVSDFVKDYFIKRTKGINNNLHTIYNGISFDDLDNTQLPELITREGLGIKNDDVTVSFIASFYPTKGQCGMIGVMEELIKIKKNIKLLFVGNVGEKQYYEKFMEYLNQSPAKDNIILVPYFQHKYMGEFLRKTTDVFILPTLQEGCSNAVLEAMYCDKPIIMTNIGNAEQVRARGGYIIVQPPYNDLVSMTNQDIVAVSCKKDMPNQKEIVNAIIEITNDLDRYAKESVSSWEDKKQYSTSKMVDEYVRLIKDETE